MFVRRTQTSSRDQGEVYWTYRLVHAVRSGQKIKQMTLLNLGSRFTLPQAQWPLMCARIDELLNGTPVLIPMGLSEDAETMAQRYAAQILARRPNLAQTVPGTRAGTEEGQPLEQNVHTLSDMPTTLPEPPEHAATHELTEKPEEKLDIPVPCETASDRFQRVDLDTLELVRPRSIGVEAAALSAMNACGFLEKLTELGFNRPQIAAAVGNIIGRMAEPGSELATHAWLGHRSGLGELLDFDFEGMDLNRLYRSSDQLFRHREVLQDHLFARAKSLFGFEETVTLYDLTNTYFEGTAQGVDKAAHGRSKEKRSDCPLVTLGMILDASGFVRRSQVFSGNVSEPATIETMLKGLGALPGATVVMDAGIATEANLLMLRQQGFHYLVVSRQRTRQFNPEQATELETAGGETIRIERKVRPLPPLVKPTSTDEGGKPADTSTGALPPEVGTEVLLYCHSSGREQKDRSIDESKTGKLIAALQTLHDSLTKPRTNNEVESVAKKIGRLQQRYARVAQHYEVTLNKDETEKKVTSITWVFKPKPASAITHPGVCCLRTTLTEPDDDTLWRTYTMLTQLESVFRSLKTDLGLRPVYHQIEHRVEGHLFISVLAYHFVHVIRKQLKDNKISDSWQNLRKIFAQQQRITATVKCEDGKTAHVRKATRPEPYHLKLCQLLNIPVYPGGTHRTLI